MDEWETYELECEKRKSENALYLAEFSKYLKEKALSEKTIKKHITNCEFFLNEYLVYASPLTAIEGIMYVGDFLGDWFIRKTMWASVTSIKENLSSLKHFYAYMLSKDHIVKAAYNKLLLDIKKNKARWLETMSAFDDPDTSFDDIW